MEVKCPACKHNFCFSHRYADAHYCTGMRVNDKLKKSKAENLKPNTDNDESLARALQELWNNELSQNEAQRIQSAEDYRNRRRARAGDGQNCNIS